MILDQHQIAHLSDNEVKRLALNFSELALECPQPYRALYLDAAHSLVLALKLRRSAWLLLEAELMNNDGSGALADSPEAAEDLRLFRDGR